ncbi:MAG: hypothetical protein NTX83_08015 [Burkholderiales bacterium]|nr:hypothetical protein [Burkholderiales bacterium]
MLQKDDELGARITGSAAKASGAKAINTMPCSIRAVLRFKEWQNGLRGFEINSSNARVMRSF